MFRATLRSLGGYNYRLWAAGALVSNIGAWMQRTAQDWIVYTELTTNGGAAIGFTMALQFGPPLFLLPLSGYVADRFDRRDADVHPVRLRAPGAGLLQSPSEH